MIYGLYLSATGVIGNSYRQNVLANNLANGETVGFKRDLAQFQQRATAAQETPSRLQWSDKIREQIGGGTFASPTVMDRSPGEPEPTGNDLDVAIQGDGFFRVLQDGKTQLTRDGRFMVDRNGRLMLANTPGSLVTDQLGNPITVDPKRRAAVSYDGQVTQDGKPVAMLGIVDVPAGPGLTKNGNNLLSYPSADKLVQSRGTTLRPGFVERANVDPATELAQLMDAQRQLEANANMIRYQDQTLGKLVNEVGKIG